MMAIVLAAGLVLAACGGAKNAGKSTTSDPSKSSTTTAPAHSSTTTTPIATTTIPFTVSQVKTGTGPATLSTFTVATKAKEWDLDWVFDCTKIPAKTGSFKVSVVGHGSASDTTDAGVTESGGGTAGLVRNYDTGNFNLTVATPCTWTVRVEVIT
jgi:autotransporter translocation and assembly factor TamB